MRGNEEAPRAERDDLDDADDVVDRRVVRSLLVPVVEAVDPREQHPQRKARHEEGDLPTGRDPIRSRIRRREVHGDDIRACEADDVGHEKKPPHEPSTPPTGGRPRATRFINGSIALCDGDRILRYCAQPSPPPSPGLPPQQSATFPSCSTE